MTNFLTEETPGKVMGLVGASLFSLALMLGVSMTDASFSGTQMALVDPFAPEKIMAVVDTAAASYSNLLTINFIQPLVADYKIYGENLSWLAEESGIAYAMGFESVDSQNASVALVSLEPRVAGVYSKKQVKRPSLSIDTLYSILIR